MAVDPAETVAVILAAGLGRRWGAGDKLKAAVDGKTLLAHVTDSAAAAGFAAPAVVLPPDSARTVNRNAVCTPLMNPNPARGLASSVGIAAQYAKARAGSDWLLILLADMPYISPALLREMLAQASPALDAVACDHPPAGPPVLWHRRQFAALMALEGDQGGAALLRGPARRVRLLTPPAAQLRDIDRPEDLP